MMYCVSVVVPTYKRSDLLSRCLSALLEQDFEPATYEILVVDDAASDETRRQVEGIAQYGQGSGHTLRYIPNTGIPGPAAARNLGWRAASSDIIAFTDDDCLPTPGWLQAGVTAFTDGIGGVAGKITVPIEHIPTDYELNATHLESAHFATANCFYRRDTLEQVGGFDEHFTVAWREDSDLVFTLRKHGAKLVYAPEALVIHPVRPARWGVSLSQQRKSIFNALLYKKHPALYRERIQASPPWHYYAIVGALLLACGAAIGGLWSLALVGVGIWLALTTRFCLQRLQRTSHAPAHVAEMIVTSVLIPPLAIFWRIRGALKYRVLFL